MQASAAAGQAPWAAAWGMAVLAIVVTGAPVVGEILEHFPEKWAPVFRRKCDKSKIRVRFPLQVKRKAIRRNKPAAVQENGPQSGRLAGRRHG
jgi:hypothetical protein